MTFMFGRGLLEDDRFKVENCVEQNSALLARQDSQGDDSVSRQPQLLPAGLEKFSRSSNTKLTETVDHEDITADNWHSFTELPRYRERLQGLYEALGPSKQTFEATAQDEFRGCEAYTRQI